VTQCTRGAERGTLHAEMVACEVQKAMALATARGKKTSASVVSKARAHCPCIACQRYKRERKGLALVKRAR
jgi:hypothetical protein